MEIERSGEVYADFVVPHLHQGARLVDVGCGSGALTLGLASLVGRVIGVDADSEAAIAAQHSAKSRGIRNADFVAGDALSLPLASASADVVFGHSVLEAVTRPGQAITEMVRTLRAGGVLAVATSSTTD